MKAEKQPWQIRDEDPHLIPCIGQDNSRHVCYPWSDTCFCGMPVKRKKLLRDDWELSNCYDCTY